MSATTELEHKGYRGELLENGAWRIVAIVGISDTISAHVEDPVFAKDIFRDLVEDYLATCSELGKEPCAPSEHQQAQGHPQ